MTKSNKLDNKSNIREKNLKKSKKKKKTGLAALSASDAKFMQLLNQGYKQGEAYRIIKPKIADKSVDSAASRRLQKIRESLGDLGYLDAIGLDLTNLGSKLWELVHAEIVIPAKGDSKEIRKPDYRHIAKGLELALKYKEAYSSEVEDKTNPIILAMKEMGSSLLEEDYNGE